MNVLFRFGTGVSSFERPEEVAVTPEELRALPAPLKTRYREIRPRPW